MLFWLIQVLIGLVSLILLLTLIFFGVGFGLENHYHKKRSNSLKDLLRRVTNELNARKIEFWLDFGTLLGYHREGDIIKGDLDCDLGMKREDKPLLDAVMKSLQKENITSIALPQLTKFYNSEDENIMLDVYMYEKVGDEWLYHNQKLQRTLKTKDSDIFPLESAVFCESFIYIPRNIHNCLLVRYGEDYMTPKPFFKGAEHEGKYNNVKAAGLRCAMTWREILKLKRKPETNEHSEESSKNTK